MLVSMISPGAVDCAGNAFGEDRDAGSASSIRMGHASAEIRQTFDSVRANMRTFVPVYYDTRGRPREDVRNGKIQGR